MKTCLILTGGKLDLDFAGDFLRDRTFDVVIAVDGGLEAELALGGIPDLAVGDFDTVKPETLAYFKAKQGILFEEHQPEKDETDTELALRLAAREGCTDITLLGATGGRMDHAIGNIHLLYHCLRQGIRASIVDRNNRIYIVDRGRTFHRDELWGKYISFLPLTEAVRGITLTGFKYPLYDQDIEIGTSLCISNELAEETGELSFREGALICVESHD